MTAAPGRSGPSVPDAHVSLLALCYLHGAPFSGKQGIGCLRGGRRSEAQARAGDFGGPTVGRTMSRVRAEPAVVRWPLAYTLRCASSSTAEQRTLNPQVSGSNPEGRTVWADGRQCPTALAISLSPVGREWTRAFIGMLGFRHTNKVRHLFCDLTIPAVRCVHVPKRHPLARPSRTRHRVAQSGSGIGCFRNCEMPQVVDVKPRKSQLRADLIEGSPESLRSHWERLYGL